MKQNPYRVLGARVPPLLGRRDLVARIEHHLDKASPDHVSVVGPAMYGKSVVLKEIARRYAPGRGPLLVGQAGSELPFLDLALLDDQRGRLGDRVPVLAQIG